MSNLDEQLQKLRIDKSRKRRGNAAVGRGLMILAIAVAAASAYRVYTTQYRAIAVKTAKVDIETLIAGKGTAEVTASGYIVPCQKIEVSSMLIARVKEMLVDRGDRVKAGDVLIRLEDQEYQSRLRSAEAAVATFKARLAEMKAGSRPQEIEAAKASVAAAEATLKNADLEFARLDKLSKDGAVARQELDRARAARDVAQARLEAERKGAEIVRIGPRAEEIAAVEAQLQQAEAEANYAKTMLEYAEIRAPIDGVVLEKLAEQGELVTNMNFGGTRGAKSSVVAMADLDCLKVEVDLNEADLGKVRLEQPCEIRLDIQPDTAYDGVVDDVSPQADRQKGTVQVKVRMLHPDASIKTEVNARVTFLSPVPPAEAGKTAKPRMWIPKNAVVKQDGGAAVYVVAGDAAKLKPIQVKGETDRGVEVAEGLDGAETIIVDPGPKLRDGARVRVTP